MKKHLLLFALLFGFAASADAQYSPHIDRNAQVSPNNRGRGGYNPGQNSWQPDNRYARCNGNCACGGRAFYYEAMPDADFAAAVQQLKSQSFDADRLRTARYIASNSYLSTRQVVAMANLFSFSDSKKNFLMAAFPSVLDKNMYFQAVNTLSFSKDREEVWDAVENMRTQ